MLKMGQVDRWGGAKTRVWSGVGGKTCRLQQLLPSGVNKVV